MTNFQIVSDLHIEWGIIDLKPNNDTILIIAGDLCEIRNIHHIKTFYDLYSPQYKYIIEVLGNHSYYFNTINCAIEYQSFLKQYPNVILLDNDKITIDDIDILGTVLWSDFNKNNPMTMWYCNNKTHGISDFQVIQTIRNNKTVRFQSEDAYQLFLQNVDWLNNNITNNKTIVITHHAPSYQSIHEKYKTSEISGGYASDLEQFIIDNPQIKYWIHGHTHESFDYNIDNTRVICNPLGYTFNINKEFNDNFIITL